MEKLDRLGTCLALMAPAGFVALGCHTSVAGPPFTLRGSWTTPRQAHRRSERRTRLSAAGRLISDSPPRSASAWMAAAPLAASRPNTTRTLDIPSSDRSREHVWVVLVVGMQRQATVEARDRRQRSDHQAPAAGEHLDTRGDRQTPAQVGDPGGQPVATANLRPDLGVVRDVGPHDLVGNAEQVTQQPRQLGLQPHERPLRPIGEGDDADAVVGGHQELGVEARNEPVVPDQEMRAGLGPDDSEPPPGKRGSGR